MALFRTIGRRDERGDTGFTKFADLYTAPVAAGVSVTQDTALTLPVVYRCIALNSETIGALPVDVLRKSGGKRTEIDPPAWVLKPNDEQDWQAFVTQVQLSLELDGNAFLMKAASGGGSISALYVLAPSAVTAERRRLADGTAYLLYHVKLDGGKTRTLGANEVVHIRALTKPGELRGLSPVALLRESIGVGLAAQEFGARFFGSGATLSGVVEIPGSIRPEDAERLQAAFTKKHGGLSKSHAVGILSGGASFKPFSVKPDEAQFIETSRVTATQIALAFGVPPNYATDAEGTKGYVTGVAAGKLMWLQTGLLTRITRLENAFSALLPRPQYIRLNLRGFLRGDPQEESAYLSAQWDRGVINANEWRALLDFNPREGGDVYMAPLNFAVAPMEQEPEEEPEPPEPMEPEPPEPDEDETPPDEEATDE